MNTSQTETKHTPGPFVRAGEDGRFIWAGKPSNGDPGTRFIAEVHSPVRRGDRLPADVEGNANLFAAAPDLLAAASRGRTVPSYSDHGDAIVFSGADAAALRAAIAKAEGRISYNAARIAWELQRTAMGDGHYGNALRVAKDIPGVTDDDRALLDRFAIGRNGGTDHVALQDLALRIDASTKAEGRS